LIINPPEPDVRMRHLLTARPVRKFTFRHRRYRLAGRLAAMPELRRYPLGNAACADRWKRCGAGNRAWV